MLPEMSEATVDPVEEVGRIVRAVVHDHRCMGVGLAIASTADILCLGVRRTRGYWNFEIRAVPPTEVEDVRTAYAGYLEQRREDLAMEARGIGEWLRTAADRWGDDGAGEAA